VPQASARPQARSPALPLALTLGEPAGIGPDIAIAAWRRRAELALPPFYIIADSAYLARRAERLGVALPLRAVAPGAAPDAFATALPVVELGLAVGAEPGRPDASSAPAAIAAIRRAVADVLAGAASAIVTNPVAKNVLYRSGFAEPGHTEFLARLAAEATGRTAHPVMMLWSAELAVVPVTIHLPLAEVPAKLDRALIETTGRIVDRDLRDRFGITRPRLAVAGLNPHAGEEGALGAEDLAIVAPAVERLRAEGIDARGPLPADTMFHPAARASYDAALAMYHDQALIPIKTLAFDHAVNVTLGLPFVRTSPDHGTAFDIAGTGRADPSSLIAAIRLAARLAARAPAAA
jgi:4-hydroxythreonine-4-phosphate dehydrogenase